MRFERVWVAPLALLLSGCGCGVFPVENTVTGAGRVESDGTVVFDMVDVRSTAVFDLPVKESADTDETIVSARTTGDFEVLSPFPLYVPRGSAVTIQIAFTPTTAGPRSGDLELYTEKMGVSRVPLRGTGW